MEFLNYAKKEIQALYGIQSQLFVKKSLFMQGRSTDVDSIDVATLWNPIMPTTDKNETYVATNAIDRISSSSASDTVIIRIEGHTVDGSGNFTFVTQDATLNGQTAVTLATPLARVHRMYNIGASNLVGSVYIYENTAIALGVPVDLTKVHDAIIILLNYNESMKGAFTTASTEYLVILNMYFSSNKEVASTLNGFLDVREKGKIFRVRHGIYNASSTGSNTYEKKFEPFIIIPPNTDLRLRVLQSGTNAYINGGLQGLILGV